jgi:hypothetical protein
MRPGANRTGSPNPACCHAADLVAVHESSVTSVQESIERRGDFLDASVDPTEARKHLRNLDKHFRQAKVKVPANRRS